MVIVQSFIANHMDCSDNDDAWAVNWKTYMLSSTETGLSKKLTQMPQLANKQLHNDSNTMNQYC